jgi:integrase/recombinase XerD
MMPPLFPKTLLKQNEDKHFKANGMTVEHWKTTSSIRKIFKEAFEGVKLRYYNPHSFRHAISHLFQNRCSNMEEIKAWN